MSEKASRNLARAFAEESRAVVRNRAFALKAEQDGFPELARLFRAAADAGSVHARRFLYLMRGKIGDTADNLKTAMDNNIRAATDEYPRMAEDAAGEPKAVRKAFQQSMETDRQHADLYGSAVGDLLKGTDHQYFVCQICGHISVGFIPENCPVCHAVPGRFKNVV